MKKITAMRINGKPLTMCKLGGGILMDNVEIYDELDCIMANATKAHIDTSVIASDKITIQIQFLVKKYGGGAIMGYVIDDYTKSYRFFVTNGTLFFDVDGYRHRITTAGRLDYVCNLEFGYCYIKNLDSGVIHNRRDTWGEWSHGRTIPMPGDSSGEYAYYGVKIYESGELVRDLRPAMRRSDGEVGMADLVTQTFFANIGEGVFEPGEPTGIQYKLRKQ